jgi:hypothetical protein
VFLNVGAAYEHFSKGEALKGTEKLLPSAVGSAVKGYREYTEGITTETYAPVFEGNERVKGTPLDFATRLFSFNPTRISEIRQRTWREDQVRLEYQKDRSRIAAGFNKALIDPSSLDQDTLGGLYADIAIYNKRVAAMDPKYQVPYITAKWLRSNLKRSQTPDKYEQMK